jgi:high affinity sulfate transporter 1
MFLEKVLRPVAWIPRYRPADLKWDILSGVTLAFFAIPTSMAYANLAGLPPESGIYCYFFAGLLYFLFGTSRQLAIGPTSSMAIVVSASIGLMAGDDPGRAMLLASASALMMAGFYFIAYLVKLSSLVNFISDTILTGFKAGAALVIASTQLPKLLGIDGGGGNFTERIWQVVLHTADINYAVFCFGLVSLIILTAGNYFFKGKPVSLIVVIVSILIATVFPLEQFGIKPVGQIPEGIPFPTFPLVSMADLNDLFLTSLALFFLSYVESISAARTIARDKGYEVDPRQELLALGAANLASAAGHGFAVAGGLSQSRVNEKAGAKSLFSLIFASAVLGVSLIFFTGLFKALPQVILAVIVLDAVAGLINVRELRHLYFASRPEFWVSILTILMVLAFGVLQGILLASLFSIFMLLRQSATPHIAILGRIPGTSNFSDILRHPDNMPVPDVLIIRPESSILYYNIQFIREEIKKMIEAKQGKVNLVIMDLSSASVVDVAGARFLLHLEDDLEKKHIRLRIVEALGSVRDLLRVEGMEKEIGRISRRVSLNDVLEEYHASLRHDQKS